MITHWLRTDCKVYLLIVILNINMHFTVGKYNIYVYIREEKGDVLLNTSSFKGGKSESETRKLEFRSEHREMRRCGMWGVRVNIT